MKTYYPVRIPGFLLIILLIIPASLFLSCNKMDVSYFADRPQLTGQDLGSKVFSSVSGFVTNENDDPVAGAKVALGNITTTTDMYGYFEANDAQVSANAAVVTVSKKGYFNGTKTYLAAANNDAFFRIKLIPKTIAGSIDATIGGSVKLNNGMRISYPANGIIHASGGAAYNGTVNVAAFWINPVADDLNKILPGDQRGITKNGEMKGLVTYGMAAVELTDAGGELLQIAPGKNATITMPVPTEILFRAPASIPLWYFDEAIGLWKEQGIAQKVGNTYIGDVSHFSIWNYDDSESFVDLDFTAVNASGAPMKNALVKISYLNDPNNARFTYTDAHGHSAGIVPGNADLRIEIMGDEACGTSVYNQTFSTAANNISLGTITVNASSGTATVSGTLTDCSNNPVNNGSIIMQKNGQYYRFPVNKNGAYHFSTLLCNTTATVNLIAFNNSGAVYNAPAPYTLTAGTNTNDLLNCHICQSKGPMLERQGHE